MTTTGPYGSSTRDARAATLIGLLAISSSAAYFLSDAIEVAQGRFSDGQLWLTLVAEATIPVFVVGLSIVQAPRLGRLGQLSAIAYAYAYVYFTGTVVYALANQTADFGVLSDELDPAMSVHGVVMVLAGIGFGRAVARAGALPRWTGITLIVGVVLVAIAQGGPELVQLLAAGVRDVAFVGMGAALIRSGALAAAGAERRPRASGQVSGPG